jgi:hypothetical protein
VFLFAPTVLACVRLARRGARAVLTSRTLLVLAPVASLVLIVAYATGEVRYRLPFDMFFIVVACAYAAVIWRASKGWPRMPDRPVGRARALLHSPWLWVGLVYLCGVAVRAFYTFHVQPPERFITSDMYFYVTLAQKFLVSKGPVDPSDVTHPLGYPALIAFLISGGGSLARVVGLQFLVSCLVPRRWACSRRWRTGGGPRSSR